MLTLKCVLMATSPRAGARAGAGAGARVCANGNIKCDCDCNCNCDCDCDCDCNSHREVIMIATINVMLCSLEQGGRVWGRM